MREGRRPSVRFKAHVEDTRESERAGRRAGEQDAAELDDLDAEAAWLERVHEGGTDSPTQHAAFTGAYAAGYDFAFTSADPQPAEEVSDGV
jgi:hypothetical protein